MGGEGWGWVEGQGRHTLPGQYSNGDAGVTELDERATLAVNALTGQEEVFSAHISMDQVLILLQREKGEPSEVAHEDACLCSFPYVLCFQHWPLRSVLHIPQLQPDPGSLVLPLIIWVVWVHYTMSPCPSFLISDTRK